MDGGVAGDGDGRGWGWECIVGVGREYGVELSGLGWTGGWCVERWGGVYREGMRRGLERWECGIDGGVWSGWGGW